MNRLIALIRSHGHEATESNGALVVTCWATSRHDGEIRSYRITETIHPSKPSVLAWLGY